jgi:hypothetical protein
MTLDITKDPQPIDLPEGAYIRRSKPADPGVSMSSRDRWSVCALSAVLPQVRTPSGPAALEGIEAHKLAEHQLHSWFNGSHEDPPAVTMPPGLERTYTETDRTAWRIELGKYAVTYAEKLAGLFGDCIMRPTGALVEYKFRDVVIAGVKLFCVADVLAYNGGADRLVAGDYKFGRSPVGVGTVDEPNPQVAGSLVLYAGSLARVPKQLGMFVYQPRIRFGEPWQVLAPLTPEWLEGERNKLRLELQDVRHAAAELAKGRLVDPTPGDHCKYCPSARWCPAANDFGKVALEVDAGTRAVVDLTPAEVMALWSARSAFKQFEDDLKERVKMLHERQDPSVTVKRRAGNHMWANPAAAVELLMLSGRADLLQPPGIAAVREAGLPEGDVAALLTRAPDVLTYAAADGKNPSLAASAFAKYLENK